MTSRIIRTADDLRRASTALMGLSLDRPLRVTVELYKPEHSDEQRNTFYGWCGLVAKHFRDAGLACSSAHIHDAVLIDCYGAEANPLNPSIVRPAQTLTKPRRLNKVELTELLHHFDAWAAERDIQLPQPNSGQKWEIAA